MREALISATGKHDVFSGEVWVIPDQRITFGDYDLKVRTTHETRYVLVLQGDEIAGNASCQTILIAPLSSQVQRKRPWEDLLSDSESPLTRPSIVKLQLIQPIPRRVLVDDGDYIGTIDDPVLDRLRVHLIRNLGIR